MEAAGLALGVAGLAGLFSTCLECYQLVQRGTAMQKDAAILMTKFENQELRLTAWGRACGLFGPEEYDARLDDPDLSVRLVATLCCIKSLFQDEKDLSARYGLRPGPPPPANAIAAPPYSGTSAETAGEEVLTLPTKWPLGSYFRRKRQRQRFSLLNKAQWAIADREKFAELIQHLKDFNDDLEAMTRATDVPRRQKIVVEYEIEEVEDIEVLEEIAMASFSDRDDEGDVVSDTASIRLERIREGGSIRTVSVRTGTNSRSSASFVTARSSLSLSIDEVVMDFQYRDDVSTIERSSLETSWRYISTTIFVEQGLDSSSSSNSTPTGTQTGPRRKEGTKTKVKCIVLGDSGVRITELLAAITRRYYPPNVTPADFKDYVIHLQCDGRSIELTLWDLSGQQDYPQLRKASYDGTDVVLICCNPNYSARLITKSLNKLAEEVTASCPEAAIVLVGILCEDFDSRLGLGSTASVIIKETSELKIQAVAGRSGSKVVAHVVCDVISGENVGDVFEMATRAAMRSKGGDPPPRTTRRRPNLAGLFSGLRRIKEEDGD